MKRLRAATFCLIIAIVLLLPTTVSARPPAEGKLRDPVDTVEGSEPPTVLVSQDVAHVTLQGQKAWWWYTKTCSPTADGAAGNWRVEEIARTPTAGGLTRSAFAHEVEVTYCGYWRPELLSNVEADESHLFWMSEEYNGLVKLPVASNVGDEPALVYDGQSDADEIVERGDEHVWLMDDAYGILRVNKNDGSRTEIASTTNLGGASHDLQIDEDYLYWIQNSGSYLKFITANGGPGSGIATGVTSYVPDVALCLPTSPCYDYVMLAQGNQIRRYNIDQGTFAPPLYTSPVRNAVIVDMVTDFSYVYFFEQRPTVCDPFCSYTYGLYRRAKTGTAPPALLYAITDPTYWTMEFDLARGGPSGNYLYWTDFDQLKRLPRDVAAIPSVDVAITDVEVTQAIQDLDQSVALIRSKRTGVRVHVDAAGQNVPGITARLYRINSVGGILAGPLYPTPGGNYLTVPNNPNRATFNHAFYFELPTSWIDGSNVRLRADVNYTQLPPEPTYANNTMSTAVLGLNASPTLKSHLLVWGYTVAGTYYQPRTVQDVQQARSWIRRTYPLASTTGGYGSSSPGFRLKIRTINDPNLGGHILRTSSMCLDTPAADREFCAATYTNNCAKWLRATEGIPNSQMIYSMIWNDPTLPFPRGFATGSVSAGPTGPQTWGWDNDGSSGDWYMGHEIGHNVGRAHPSQGNSCGHSASDSNFPYSGAAIGTGNMWGFDVGDPGLNSSLVARVYPNSTWRDMMSYCSNQWISDYTYEGIYDFLTSQQAVAEPTPRPVRAGTDTIALFGTIYDAHDTASFQVVGMWDSPGPYSPPAGGPYRMRFLDASRSELAAYNFEGEASDIDPTDLGFDVVVPFPAGTTTIELIRVADSALLATHTVSASAPTIGNVRLVGATPPVTGTVELAWDASDPDGDPLMFDVYYTDNDGATYTAYALALSSPTVQLDSAQLAGSSQARFRVTANDGTRLAEAESATFTMAPKPPTVTFLAPADGTEVTYGTQISFLAEVEDLQGDVPDASMSWFIDGTPAGATGPSYTAYLLPTGTHVVSLRATNSRGLTTERGVTVVVNDDVAYPGPTLNVGPDQLGWQLPEGTTAVQTATLTISNLGTGSLTWTASEDVSWLALDLASGNTPGEIVVSADPSALTPGVPVSTVITIAGSNGQSVQLPISLLVGVSPAWTNEPATSFQLFLPLGLRQP